MFPPALVVGVVGGLKSSIKLPHGMANLEPAKARTVSSGSGAIELAEWFPVAPLLLALARFNLGRPFGQEKSVVVVVVGQVGLKLKLVGISDI